MKIPAYSPKETVDSAVSDIKEQLAGPDVKMILFLRPLFMMQTPLPARCSMLSAIRLFSVAQFPVKS
jgi:hypothetical protein